MNSNSTSVGSTIRPAAGTVPAAPAAGTRTGAAIDRDGFDSCVLFVQAGAATGAPTTLSLTAKLTECATSGGSYTDVPGAAITAITAVSTSARVNVDLSGCLRYLKVSETVAFTGGTAPTLGAASSVVLGGADSYPVTG